MTIYHENFYNAKKFQKKVYDKNIKPKSYALGNKVQLNNKYI